MIRQDGTGQRKAFPRPILDFVDVSPDRRFNVIITPEPDSPDGPGRKVLAIPFDGGAPQEICDGYCVTAWSPDGRYFYIEIAPKTHNNPDERTVAIRIPPGKTLPAFSPELIQHPGKWADVPGVDIVERASFVPGLNPSFYAYIKASVHANLYRIPLQ